MKPGSAAWRRSKRRREKTPVLRESVAALIALNFAVFVDAAHGWLSCDIDRGFAFGGVDHAMSRFRQNIDAIFQQGGGT